MRKQRYITYVISLDKKPPVLEHLRQHNLLPNLIHGVDGSKCDQRKLVKHFHPVYVDFGPRSAQGCAMSHIKVWREFIKSDNEFAFIFEDDVVLEPKFTSQLQQVLEQVPADFDMLSLGCFGSENDPNFFTVVLGMLGLTQTPQHVSERIKIPRIALATHAYVLSRKGAEKLIKLLDGKLYNHIDYCIQWLSVNNQINRYVATPRLAYQTSSDGTTSSNISSSHPKLITNLLDKIYLDTRVRASYVSSLSVARMGEQVISVSSLLFLLFGFILAGAKGDINTISVIYLIVSLPDILLSKSSNDVNTVWFHYLLLVFPTVILSF
uniref:Glycosyl transferase family 25 domain-containing protein n=1 Tax=viral metagenome TaxID=1070528 RepID=A0A6C0H7W7_9ZZZZ